MKTQIVINGGVTIVLEPESTMEEEILKNLVKQDSVITDVRGQVMILSKQIRGSVIICKRSETMDTGDANSC